MSTQSFQLLKICKKKDPSLSKNYLIYIREFCEEMPYSYDDNIGGHTWLCEFNFSSEGEKLVVDVFMNSHDTEYQDSFYGLQNITSSCSFKFAIITKCHETLVNRLEETTNQSKLRYKLLCKAQNSLKLVMINWHDLTWLS